MPKYLKKRRLGSTKNQLSYKNDKFRQPGSRVKRTKTSAEMNTLQFIKKHPWEVFFISIAVVSATVTVLIFLHNFYINILNSKHESQLEQLRLEIRINVLDSKLFKQKVDSLTADNVNLKKQIDNLIASNSKLNNTNPKPKTTLFYKVNLNLPYEVLRSTYNIYIDENPQLENQKSFEFPEGQHTISIIYKDEFGDQYRWSDQVMIDKDRDIFIKKSDFMKINGG